MSGVGTGSRVDGSPGDPPPSVEAGDAAAGVKENDASRSALPPRTVPGSSGSSSVETTTGRKNALGCTETGRCRCTQPTDRPTDAAVITHANDRIAVLVPASSPGRLPGSNLLTVGSVRTRRVRRHAAHGPLHRAAVHGPDGWPGLTLVPVEQTPADSPPAAAPPSSAPGAAQRPAPVAGTKVVTTVVADRQGRGAPADGPDASAAGRPLGTRRVHAAYLLIIGLLVMSAVVYDGLRRENAGAGVILLREPPGPSAGVAATSPATPSAPVAANSAAPSTLRVATFNIASGRGRDGRTDLSRTLDTLRGALPLDVVALQESRPAWWGGGGHTRELAASLVMRWADVPSERRWWREHFGNAVLVGGRGSAVLRIPLPQTQERGQRNVGLLRIELPSADGPVEVTVLFTHIDRRVDQPDQLRFVLDLFRAVDAPAVLLGDLNVTRTHPLLRELTDQTDAVDAIANVPDVETPGRIDHILVRGLRPVGAGRIDLGASDHPLIWAELALPLGGDR